jgi:hypothetical protein
VRFPTSTLISPSYPFWIPRFPDSRIPRFPDSPIPGFPDSRIPRFPDSPIPRFPDSPFPVLKIAITMTSLSKLFINEMLSVCKQDIVIYTQTINTRVFLINHMLKGISHPVQQRKRLNDLHKTKNRNTLEPVIHKTIWIRVLPTQNGLNRTLQGHMKYVSRISNGSGKKLALLPKMSNFRPLFRICLYQVHFLLAHWFLHWT